MRLSETQRDCLDQAANAGFVIREWPYCLERNAFAGTTLRSLVTRGLLVVHDPFQGDAPLSDGHIYYVLTDAGRDAQLAINRSGV